MDTLLDLSKTWVEDNNRFSPPPFVPKIINNYRTAHWYIKPQAIDEQGVNKLQPELFIKGKYVKIMLKKGSHHAIFWVLEVKRSKILQKLNKRDFLFTFLVSFFMSLFAQKLIYTIDIWFNFVFG